MISSFNTFTIIIIAALSVALCLYWTHVRKRGSRLPPGPPGLPILGNLYDFPTTYEWLAYKEMSLKHQSDIIHLRVLGTSVIVIHDLKSVRDLMERRSSLYSDRPRSVMLSELMGWGNNMAFAAYGDFWRASRRAIHQEFNPKVISQYYPEQVKATRELLRRLLRAPERWQEHLRHQAGAVTLAIAYGIEILSENDPHIDLAEQALRGIHAASMPGAFLVDTIPWLKYIPASFPGAEFQKKARGWKEKQQAMVHDTYNIFKRDLFEGSTRSSYCSRHLSKVDPDRDIDQQELIIRETASVVYGAGADTTVSALGTFFLAMVQYPEVQAKAQAELDAVIGTGRLPVFGDEENLPYLMAVVKECLRWQAISPIGVPHRLVADDEYKGYFLPAGSIVVANTWAILHDEKAYPNPFSFKPERFLKDGMLDPSVQDPALAAFGYGRRICPGRHVALGSIWVTVSSVLATYHITKAVDANGVFIEPSGLYTSGLISHPEPFKCEFKARSKKMEDMVMVMAVDSI